VIFNFLAVLKRNEICADASEPCVTSLYRSTRHGSALSVPFPAVRLEAERRSL
jgi:hypothetical protein